MTRTLAVAAGTATLLLLTLSSSSAAPCRVYDDTSFIGIPGQCGRTFRARPRPLYLRAPRKLQYYYCP
jgi:hypothetical protein